MLCISWQCSISAETCCQQKVPLYIYIYVCVCVCVCVCVYIEGSISGRKAVGRPRLQYSKQVARNTGADSNTAMKRMACNNSRWKAANQSKDWRIRRWRRRRRRRRRRRCMCVCMCALAKFSVTRQAQRNVFWKSTSNLFLIYCYYT